MVSFRGLSFNSNEFDSWHFFWAASVRARYSPGCWGRRREQDTPRPWSHGVYILVGERELRSNFENNFWIRALKIIKQDREKASQRNWYLSWDLETKGRQPLGRNGPDRETCEGLTREKVCVSQGWGEGCEGGSGLLHFGILLCSPESVTCSWIRNGSECFWLL